MFQSLSYYIAEYIITKIKTVAKCKVDTIWMANSLTVTELKFNILKKVDQYSIYALVT